METEYRVLSHIEESPNLTRLYSELVGESMVPDIGKINELISSGGLAFYSVWVDGQLAGMTSIIPVRTALSNKLWIEDVAVLSDFRGLGLGRKLLEYAMDDAPQRFFPGAFYLTSRPFRVAARKLYASMGFKEEETGLFCKK